MPQSQGASHHPFSPSALLSHPLLIPNPPHTLSCFLPGLRGEGRSGPGAGWKTAPPDHGPGPRCESLVDIYSQLQQEVGAAGGELDPKTRAALISRLDEVLRTLVTRYEPPCLMESRPQGNRRVRVVVRGGAVAPRGTQLFTSLCLPYSSQLFPGGKAAPPGSEDSDQVPGRSSIPAGPEVPGGPSQASAGQG